MAFEEGRSGPGLGHHVVLEDREQLTVSGVEEVERFDETTIVLSTTLGELIVRGQDLHIETLSLGGGDLKVEGTVEALTFQDETPRGGFFARLLG